MRIGANNEVRGIIYNPQVQSGQTQVSSEARREARAADLELNRNRVLMLSAAIAAFTILRHLTIYILGITEVSQVVQTLHNSFPDKQSSSLPNVFEMILGGIPRFAGEVAFSLAIPTCGYLGVKHKHVGLLGTFSCCNGCVGACSLCVMVLIIIMMTVMAEFEPTAVSWLHDCDPSICRELPTSAEQVDCLAGLGRETTFPTIVHLPGKCWQAAVDCPENITKTDPCANWEVGICSDEERRKYCIDLQHNAPSEERLVTEAGSSCDLVGKCVRNEAGTCVPASLPTDPVKSCKVNQDALTELTSLAELLPEFFPMIQTLMWVQVICFVPAAILACVAMCFGVTLTQKIHSGYAVVGSPQYRVQNVHQQEMVAPHRTMASP